MSIIIGTAGHIDHGKTALVKALTGIETDRLKEERERGISIDLGFAHFDADDERAGIVDVPGHERFIRNMLAGAHGIDLVLLVVAADDGVMPQTEEHLDILHLLGVRHGIVVMTKVDLVDAARRAAVREEIEIVLAGTTLEGAPLCEVSSLTGEGLPELRATIARRARDATRPEPRGCFRMPIDRVFSLRGHGLVVTGTATAGRVQSEDVVCVLPGNHAARVRTIQVHGENQPSGHWGQRLALNLSGVDRVALARGDVVCAPELDRATQRFDAHVELRPAARKGVANRAGVRVYLGTAEAMATIMWLDGRPVLEAKADTYAQLVLREPIVACGGDRFVLRDQTARQTIGGGVVLHPFATRARRSDGRLATLAAIHHAASTPQVVSALLDFESDFATTPALLAATANCTIDVVHEALRQDARAVPLPDPDHVDAYTTRDKWQRLADAIGAALTRFHAAEPRQPGMEMESLRSQLAPDTSVKVFRAVLGALEQRQMIARDGSTVRLPRHRTGLDTTEQTLGRALVQRLHDARFTPADPADLARTLGVTRSQLSEVAIQLERDGALVRASADLWFDVDAVNAARALIQEHVATHGQIDAALFRDLIGASRKFSIALLTYFDRIGFTLRVGDVRKLRRSG